LTIRTIQPAAFPLWLPPGTTEDLDAEAIRP
jgi:hypothetical protein